MTNVLKIGVSICDRYTEGYGKIIIWRRKRKVNENLYSNEANVSQKLLFFVKKMLSYKLCSLFSFPSECPETIFVFFVYFFESGQFVYRYYRQVDGFILFLMPSLLAGKKG